MIIGFGWPHTCVNSRTCEFTHLLASVSIGVTSGISNYLVFASLHLKVIHFY